MVKLQENEQNGKVNRIFTIFIKRFNFKNFDPGFNFETTLESCQFQQSIAFRGQENKKKIEIDSCEKIVF